MTGIVKWFDPKRGYGFIICAPDPASAQSPPAEVYVHYTGILSKGFRTLVRGATVRFEVSIRERGARAEQVVCISEPKQGA